MVALFLIFWGTSTVVPWWPQQPTFPPAVYRVPFFSISSPMLVISCLINNSHSKGYEVVISLWFWFTFPCKCDGKVMFTSDHLLFYLLAIGISFWRTSTQFLCPFLNWVLLLLSCMGSLFWILALYQKYHLQISSLILLAVFLSMVSFAEQQLFSLM